MAQTTLFTKQAQVMIKEESSQDTFEVPAGDGTGIFLARDVTYTEDSANYERNEVRGDGLSMDEVPGMRVATIAGTVHLHGSGAAGTAPEYDDLLKALGFEVVNTPATSDVYNPLLTFDGAGGNPGPSYSMAFLEDGVRYGVAGGFATGDFALAVGEPGKLNFTFTGAAIPIVADALEVATYNAVVPPAFMGATFATNFGGAYTPFGVENLNLDIGNQIAVGRDVNGTYGVKGTRITARKSTGSFDPEMVLVATEDFWGNQRAGTSGTIATGVIGGTAGNKWALSIGRAVLRPLTLEEREGKRTLQVPFAVSSAVTDVEGTALDISLSFT